MHSPAGYTPLSEIANSLRNSFAVAWPDTRISKEIEALGFRDLKKRRQNLDLLYGELAYFAALKNVYACDTTVQLVKLDATRLFTRCSPQRSDDSARWSRSVVHLLQYVFVEPTTYTISLTTWDNIAEDQKQSFGEDESGHLSQTANSLRTHCELSKDGHCAVQRTK